MYNLHMHFENRIFNSRHLSNLKMGESSKSKQALKITVTIVGSTNITCYAQTTCIPSPKSTVMLTMVFIR